MPASISKLRTRRAIIEAERGEQLRQLVLSFEGLPERARGEIVAAIDARTASERGWTFIMISPVQHAAVVRWLLKNSSRPRAAVELWAECFTALRLDTGEIVLTRDELAERVGVHAGHVSRIMAELEGIQAISRKRERVPGMRGPGVVRYFMNPQVATQLAGAARDRAQEQAPPVRLDIGQRRAGASHLRIVETVE